MSSYRFCRTDDIRLLVEAWNRCAPEGGATVDGFKREIRELGVWCSSCMVAFDGADPVGVLIGCKRPPETLVLRLAVHPDHRRRGHARHLLTSLSAKLAILGPPRLVAEIPEANAPARALFQACGWREDARFVDLSFEPASAQVPAGLVHEANYEEVKDTFASPEGRAWERTSPTLEARAVRLRGLVVAGAERVDASVLHEGGVAWAIHYERDAAGEAALRAILGEVARREGRSVSIPAAGNQEIDAARWSSLGLAPMRAVVRVESRAVAG